MTIGTSAATPRPEMSEDGVQPLLWARGVKKHFPVRRGILQWTVGQVLAVDGVDLDITPGETLGLVGESGCGKPTLGRTLTRLIEPTAGSIEFEGRDLVKLNASEMTRTRRDIQFIFQDPVGSLNPRMTVREIIGEGLGVYGFDNRDQRLRAILEEVGARPEAAGRYPHEFSGGQRQRVGIGPALILQPKLVIADAPVSALDVSIQAQVLNLLVDLKRDFRPTYLLVALVAHNLAVVNYISDRIAMMYLGESGRGGSLPGVTRPAPAPIHAGAAVKRSRSRCRACAGSSSCSKAMCRAPSTHLRVAASVSAASWPGRSALKRSLCSSRRWTAISQPATSPARRSPPGRPRASQLDLAAIRLQRPDVVRRRW